MLVVSFQKIHVLPVSTTVESVILDFFSKHEKSKNLSPLPKRSPSSNVDGIIRFNVSGRKSTNTEPINDKPPSTKAGSGLNIFD